MFEISRQRERNKQITSENRSIVLPVGVGSQHYRVAIEL